MVNYSSSLRSRASITPVAMAGLTNLDFPGLQAFQTAEQMELLDVVDSLRAHGLGELTELPQLIVCGDQSSGKSSVLEAISGIPFPKQDLLCTRFATEVILRRAPKEKIFVSIVPADGRTAKDKERLLQFQHDLVTRDDFPSLFEEAKNVMGLSSGKSFSEDVLRVEFCGPAQPQLTLVDLPGLIHAETESQTADDIELVANLVKHYIENSRSIILAIISAKNDASNQIILSRARKADPQSVRTLGIITKPDTLIEDSQSEKAFLNLARNQNVKFHLGWHVVMNLDSGKASAAQENRDEQEALYFQKSNFRSLPSHTFGIVSLRTRLSKILFNQIRVELPRVVKDIEDRITSSISDRDKLGPSRATVEEQRAFLIELSQSFQKICRDAIRGDYDHTFFRSDLKPERRLCANLMNKHFEFADDLHRNGSFWNIEDTKGTEVNSRTREEAIQEACKLLKYSRGREV
jgi:GTP-binding protein EngB required for normal cell division